MRLIADAYARGERGFLLANQTGTGKTFVGEGAIRQIKPRRTLIVVPNKGIARQWQREGRDVFGLHLEVGTPPDSEQPGIWITTYADLRSKARTQKGRWRFGLAIFDEAHREAMKVLDEGRTALLVGEVAGATRMAIYSTATPYENPADLAYLEPLGLWRPGEFTAWSRERGVRWSTRTVTTKYGTKKGRVVAQFVGKAPVEQGGKIHDMLEIRADIIRRGLGTFREIQLPDVPLSAPFSTVPVRSGDHGEIVGRAVDALRAAFGGSQGIQKALYIQIVKRLLDYSKLDRGAELAAQAAAEGKAAAVFVSNKSGFDFDRYRDASRCYHDWLREKQLGIADGPPPPGCSALVAAVGDVFISAGVSGSLPSPTELLRQKLAARLGEGKAALYTGDVSDRQREATKARFQSGDQPAIVATIAAGGTGLSLHDTIGNRPRVQINLGLPWTGKEFTQLVGRTYRVGTKSPVVQHFILTEHPEEQETARKVGAKLESMRAGVSGVTVDANRQKLLDFEFAEGFDVDLEEAEKLLKALFFGLPVRPPRFVLLRKSEGDIAHSGKNYLGFDRRGRVHWRRTVDDRQMSLFGPRPASAERAPAPLASSGPVVIDRPPPGGWEERDKLRPDPARRAAELQNKAAAFDRLDAERQALVLRLAGLSREQWDALPVMERGQRLEQLIDRVATIDRQRRHDEAHAAAAARRDQERAVEAARPAEFRRYGEDGAPVRDWQVSEQDYIAHRFDRTLRDADRSAAIYETQAAEASDRPRRDFPSKRAELASHAAFFATKAARLRGEGPTPAEMQGWRDDYIAFVKKAISAGEPVPRAVVSQRPEFRKAADARARYEKGRHTSFANESVAVNRTMQRERGYKVKRQDGKAITETQVAEIAQGMDQIEAVLGPSIRDLMRRSDLTVAHTSGRHPFLKQAGGLYSTGERTISMGVADCLSRPIPSLAHEFAHWLDYEAGGVIGAKAFVDRGKTRHVTSLAEQEGTRSELIGRARRTMRDTYEVRRMLREKQGEQKSEEAKAAIERVRVTLGPYWNSADEIFARLVEQYVSTVRGTGGVAAANDYTRTPGWWSAEDFAGLMPEVGREIGRRLEILGGDPSHLTGASRDLMAVAQAAGFADVAEARHAILRDVAGRYDQIQRRIVGLEHGEQVASERLKTETDTLGSPLDDRSRQRFQEWLDASRQQLAELRPQLAGRDARVPALSPEDRAAIVNAGAERLTPVVSEDAPLRKAAADRCGILVLLKAGAGDDPLAPGSRGGRGYRTRTGRWRYGVPGSAAPRTSRVTLTELQSAVADARAQYADDTNAARLAVLMHPHVYRVWQAVNRAAQPHMPPYEIERTPHGFRLYQPFQGTKMYWNRRDPERYPDGEAPGVVWDGVRRNTLHQFVDDLVAIANGYDSPAQRESGPMCRAARAGLRLVDSTAVPVDVPVGTRLERASGELVEVIGAENEDLIVRGADGGRGRLSVEAVRAGRVRRLDLPTQPGARAVDAPPHDDRPSGSSAGTASTLPPGVLHQLRHALDVLRDAEQELVRGRELDRAHGGRGRYEWDVWQARQASVVQAHQFVTKFRAAATKNKLVDPDRVIAELGGEAQPTITADAQAWQQPSERNAPLAKAGPTTAPARALLRQREALHQQLWYLTNEDQPTAHGLLMKAGLALRRARLERRLARLDTALRRIAA